MSEHEIEMGTESKWQEPSLTCISTVNYETKPCTLTSCAIEDPDLLAISLLLYMCVNLSWIYCLLLHWVICSAEDTDVLESGWNLEAYISRLCSYNTQALWYSGADELAEILGYK